MNYVTSPLNLISRHLFRLVGHTTSKHTFKSSHYRNYYINKTTLAQCDIIGSSCGNVNKQARVRVIKL